MRILRSRGRERVVFAYTIGLGSEPPNWRAKELSQRGHRDDRGDGGSVPEIRWQFLDLPAHTGQTESPRFSAFREPIPAGVLSCLAPFRSPPCGLFWSRSRRPF